MRLVVDTGIFSASLSRQPSPPRPPRGTRRTNGRQPDLPRRRHLSELRYGALVAEWGEPRRHRLEQSIKAITIVPVSDALLHTIAKVRYECRLAGHPLHDRTHANDLWIAASAIHIDAPLLADDNVFENTPGLTLRR